MLDAGSISAGETASGGEAIKGYPTRVREQESAGWVLHFAHQAMAGDLAAKERESTSKGARCIETWRSSC